VESGVVNGLVADIVAAYFYEKNLIVVKKFEDNPVSMADRKRIVRFEISFQVMCFEASVENIFLENGKTVSQLLFLFFSQFLEILEPLFFKGSIKMNGFRLHYGPYIEAIRSSIETALVLPEARFFSASPILIRNA
jgi:hypothetical protein